MSITWFSRERGIKITCDGPDFLKDCPTRATYQCGLIIAKNVRAWIKTHERWGRGLRNKRKRCDLCPKCMQVERDLLAKELAEKAERKKQRDEARKAKMAAAPLPKKPRKKKGSPEITDSGAASSPQSACEQYAPSPSPSADSAPAPAT